MTRWLSAAFAAEGHHDRTDEENAAVRTAGESNHCEQPKVEVFCFSLGVENRDLQRSRVCLTI